MKVLTLLRHAKSGWDDPIARDFDRPLNSRGRRAARTVAKEMRALGLGFDAVLASPARRVVETLEEVAGVLGPLGPRFDQKLYLASPETLLEVVRSAADEAQTLLLVGHNPGIEMLTLSLAGAGALREEAALKYPTATLAEIAFDVERWGDLRPDRGELRQFIRPRDLDPELGPDAE